MNTVFWTRVSTCEPTPSPPKKKDGLGVRFASGVNTIVLNHGIGQTVHLFIYSLTFLISMTDALQQCPAFLWIFALQSWQMDPCAVLFWGLGAMEIKQNFQNPKYKNTWTQYQWEGGPIELWLGPGNRTKCALKKPTNKQKSSQNVFCVPTKKREKIIHVWWGMSKQWQHFELRHFWVNLLQSCKMLIIKINSY